MVCSYRLLPETSGLGEQEDLQLDLGRKERTNQPEQRMDEKTQYRHEEGPGNQGRSSKEFQQDPGQRDQKELALENYARQILRGNYQSSLIKGFLSHLDPYISSFWEFIQALPGAYPSPLGKRFHRRLYGLQARRPFHLEPDSSLIEREDLSQIIRIWALRGVRQYLKGKWTNFSQCLEDVLVLGVSLWAERTLAQRHRTEVLSSILHEVGPEISSRLLSQSPPDFQEPGALSIEDCLDYYSLLSESLELSLGNRHAARISKILGIPFIDLKTVREFCNGKRQDQLSNKSL